MTIATLILDVEKNTDDMLNKLQCVRVALESVEGFSGCVGYWVDDEPREASLSALWRGATKRRGEE